MELNWIDWFIVIISRLVDLPIDTFSYVQNWCHFKNKIERFCVYDIYLQTTKTQQFWLEMQATCIGISASVSMSSLSLLSLSSSS